MLDLEKLKSTAESAPAHALVMVPQSEVLELIAEIERLRKYEPVATSDQNAATKVLPIPDWSE